MKAAEETRISMKLMVENNEYTDTAFYMEFFTPCRDEEKKNLIEDLMCRTIDEAKTIMNP